ncbi:hypothetical protein NQ315_008353 [Exocentrus adspersus]|uniref:Uncharacterized protein n=1 Tax=Exocentrus adspersus TaxID=1586481 RepID=A0AAV8VRC9_9CUCU|nr:hypothetical protein NQ315_008353 [Exocentrus adspersus]
MYSVAMLQKCKDVVDDLNHLRRALICNGLGTLNERSRGNPIPRRKKNVQKEECGDHNTYYIICRLLKKQNINTVFTTEKEITLEFPKTMSNGEDLQCPGVYNILFICWKVYMPERKTYGTNRQQNTKRSRDFKYFEISAVAEHRTDTEHNIQLEMMKVVVRKRRF